METLPSGLPESVADAEDLARFLPQSNYFNQAGVKPVAFLPNPKNLETSVFRQGGDDIPNLRRIGQENISADRTIYGAAFVKALHVRAAMLQVLASEPPAHHANIVGWPCDKDPEMEKARRKDLANQLAQHAILLRF